MKINPPNLLLAATTTLLVSSFSAARPVQALTWTMNNATVDTIPPTSITGSFTMNDESAPNPMITFSDIRIGSLIFTKTDVVTVSINAIDWVKGSDSLSLVFNSPFLTTAGGIVTLDDVVSDFTGDRVSGSVIGAANPPTTVPEPNSILSLIALGTMLVVRSRFN